MADFLFLWQHLPGSIDPVVFSIGPVPIRWYGIAYLLGAVVVFAVARWYSRTRRGAPGPGAHFDALLVVFLGAILGGRLGYVVGYGSGYSLLRPWEIVSPFGPAGEWVGISGMSFFGGAIGAVIALYFFARAKRISFLGLSDALILGLPLAIALGRLANFINGELVGRLTERPWGMYFLSDPDRLRHPSQLYEAGLEGALPFLVLLVAAQRWSAPPGMLAALFLGLYGSGRFFAEFFREPDPGSSLIFGLTLNQGFSLGTILGAVVLLWWLGRGINGILAQRKPRLTDMDKKITAAIAGALLLSLGVVWLALSGTSEEPVGEPTVPVYYYGDTCPHCKDVQKFLDENDIAAKVPYEKKEVWKDRKNAREMSAREKTCGIAPDASGVPFLYFEGKCYIGTPQVEGFFRERAGLEQT